MEENKTSKALYVLLIAIAVGFLLKVASSVTIPLAISGFCFLFLNPIVNKLEKVRIPRWFAIAIAMLILIVVFFLMILFFSISINKLIMALPKYMTRFVLIFGNLDSKLSELFGYESDISFFDTLTIDWQAVILNALSTISGSAMSILSTAVLVFIFVLFLLMERQSLIPKLRIAIPNRSGMRIAVLFERINRQIAKYLGVKTLISFATGVLFYLAAIATRLDFPIIWGILAFILNFIPSIGSVIITTLTIIMAVVQFLPDYASIIYVAVLMISIQLVLGNILDPRLQGIQLNLSPFVILVSLVFWGYIWGLVGMFLAVPLTSIIQIIFANIKGLKPIAVLISSGKSYRKQIDEEERKRKERYEKLRAQKKASRIIHHENQMKVRKHSESSDPIN